MSHLKTQKRIITTTNRHLKENDATSASTPTYTTVLQLKLRLLLQLLQTTTVNDDYDINNNKVGHKFN